MWFSEVYPDVNVDGYGVGRPCIRLVEAAYVNENVDGS